jgi:hypothetical protein
MLQLPIVKDEDNLSIFEKEIQKAEYYFLLFN